MDTSFIYNQGARFYDRIWRGFTDKTLEQTLQALDLKQLNNQVRSAGLLNIGCGTGELEFRLARLHPETKITGLDSSSQMLKQARHKLAGNKQVEFTLADANFPLPFSDASFETVVSNNLLHYIVQPDRLLQEIYRVLKPGGQIVIEDFSVHGRFFWPLFERIIRWLDPQHHKTYTLAELNQLLKLAGFIITDSRSFTIDLIWRGMFVSASKQTS